MKYWIFSMVFLTFVSENNRAKVYFKGKKISNDSRHTLTNREGESQCSTHRKLNQETAPLIVLTLTCCVTLYKLPYLSISQDFLIIK